MTSQTLTSSSSLFEIPTPSNISSWLTYDLVSGCETVKIRHSNWLVKLLDTLWTSCGGIELVCHQAAMCSTQPVRPLQIRPAFSSTPRWTASATKRAALKVGFLRRRPSPYGWSGGAPVCLHKINMPFNCVKHKHGAAIWRHDPQNDCILSRWLSRCSRSQLPVFPTSRQKKGKEVKTKTRLHWHLSTHVGRYLVVHVQHQWSPPLTLINRMRRIKAVNKASLEITYLKI